jgi:predicted esterase
MMRLARSRSTGIEARRPGVLLFLALLVGLAATPAAAQTYGFRASYESDGSRVLRTFRMWVPPEAPEVRGAVFLWAGAGQDWRDRVGWTSFQEAARALGFALVGTRDNELGVTRSEVDTALQRIMSAAAEVSSRPELSDAPVALMGFSQGGYRSALAAALSSGRVIGMVGHKGTQIVSLTDEGTEVPVLFIAGESDGSFPPDFVRQAFQTWRNEGGLAAYAVDWGVGHNDLGNQGWEAAWYWLAEVVRLRYPEAAPISPASLVEIPLEEGWLGDKARFRSDGTPFTVSPFFDIAPHAEYAGSKDAASWLPSRGAAYAYRAFTSTDLASRDEVPLQTPLVIRTPGALDTLAVGAAIEVELDLRGFGEGRTVREVVLYDGGDSLGTATLDATDPSAPVWTRTYVPSVSGIRVLTAVATASDGTRRTTFRTVVVRPEGDATSSAPPPAASLGAVTLHPNRPNPFVRSTAIRFELHRAAAVRVEVLDGLGRTVATLVDAVLAAGDHAVPFEAAGLAGGVYVTRVAVDGLAQTRPILLLR